MGLLDLLKGNMSLSNAVQSKYAKLPHIDAEADKRTPKGYVERKFIDEEKLYIKCDNVFIGSDVPIVSQCDYATKCVSTMVLQNKNGSKVRSVSEIIYYTIPENLRNNFLQIIAIINAKIMEHELDSSFIVDLRKICFNASLDGVSKIPRSRIDYDQEKREFHFIFSNEIAEKANYKYGSTIYKNTESGTFTYDENGILKKADFAKEINGQYAKIRLKAYKSGFELYDVRYNGIVVYKR